jgi:hypothetical protein
MELTSFDATTDPEAIFDRVEKLSGYVEVWLAAEVLRCWGSFLFLFAALPVHCALTTRSKQT